MLLLVDETHSTDSAPPLHTFREMADDVKPLKLLIQSEVASMLGCSVGKVQRLRLSGKLRYAAGRPVLFMESDVIEYVESLKRAGKIAVEPGSPEAVRIDNEKIVARARRAVFFRRLHEELRKAK